MSLEWRLLKAVYYPKSTAVRFCGNSYQSLEDALADGVKDFARQVSDWEIAEEPTGMAALHIKLSTEFKLRHI
jgi:hypothetical protein